MRPLKFSHLYCLLLTVCAVTTGAIAQSDVQKPPAAACTAPAEMTPLHLYGTWMGKVDGEAGPVVVRLEKHPELAGSVAGQLERDGRRVQVVGDVDEGDFTLEESSDGQRISATWIGQVVAASCGKEIKGTWTKATDSSSNTPARSFVLRKQGGWQ